MNEKQLKEVLKLHEMWLEDKEGGRRADLRDADLRHADLCRADLRGANLCGADLRHADLRGANLRRADLRHADLRHANLRGADLRGADLDFSCWPLWCGSKNVRIGDRLFYQLVAHIRSVDISQCEDPDIQKAYKYLTKLAKKCHRADELGL